MTTRQAADQRLLDALGRSDIVAVTQALRDGANPDVSRPHGEMALMTAVTRSHDASLVRLLLRAGAGVDRRDGAGRTALHVAALANQSDAVAALLEAGADANVYDKDGRSPLDYASPYSAGSATLASLFAATGTTTSLHRAKLLVQAVVDRDLERARFWLTSWSSDASLDEAALRWPLIEAVRLGDTTIGAALLEAGADPSERLEAARTPLHEASAHGRAAFARLLIDAGADLEARDVTGWTPLFDAVAAPNARGNTQLAIVALLLDAGADPGVLDIHGYQPRTKARALGRDALVELLPPLEGEPPLDESANRIAAVVLAHETGVELLWRPNDVVKPFDFSEGDARERYGHDGTAAAIEAARPGVFAALAPWFLPLLERMTKGQMPTVTEVDALHRRASGAEVVTRPFRS